MNLYDFYNAKLEYTLEAVAADKELATHIQEVLIRLKLLAPPADGKFGPISSAALREFQELMKTKEQGFLGLETAKKLIETSPDDLPQPELILGNDFASRIIKYMKSKGYQISMGTKEYNIVYIEGIDGDGRVNPDQANHFNDRRLVIQILDRKPKIIGNWDGTTEPGYHYTYRPMSPKGAARIKFGQYKAWRVGMHGTSERHEALVQVEPVTVHRDFNKDLIRTGDRLDTGYFGINQHWGYDLPRNNIYFASAGCLVGRSRQGHQEFMALIKQDRRYQLNKKYTFLATIIPGDGLPK
jgi:peptidoglycan hydrolase-like protein with peptidoglycan-binding domain